ncbi:MAG: ParB/RepB/Spo0J family partition protein [Clostridia bacterium]|jgi:ParB family chromosome partitioning protein|nr:ParB/RepB/Spo0J family partition protein [Clostridia bacterium]
MKPTRGLGKGLSALFSETEEDYGKSLIFEEAPEEAGKGVTEIEVSSIFANPNQPRKVFEPTALQELADSISKHGVIMPIIVNKSGDRYMIIAGERRFRASKLAGLEKVPVIVKNYNERQIKEISLIENLQREDLNPIEAATAMRSLMNDYGLTQEDLADRIGKSRPAIANTLRLLSLSQEVMKMVSDGALSAGHARSLVSVPHVDQLKIAEAAVKEGLSVRDVEKRVKDYFDPPEVKAKKKIKMELSAELKELIGQMQRTFGTKVNAIGNDKKGRIYIDYYTRDDLDRLAEIIEFVEKNKK